MTISEIVRGSREIDPGIFILLLSTARRSNFPQTEHRDYCHVSYAVNDN